MARWWDGGAVRGSRAADRALVKVNPSVDNVYKTMLDPAGQERIIKVREDDL